MSKSLEALAALLVKGARVTLNAYTIDGVKANNGLVGREQLIVDVDEKGGVSLIVSDPTGASELGRRYWTSPRENEVEVKGSSFTLTVGGSSKGNPKHVYEYKVVKPEAAPAAAEPAEEKATQEAQPARPAPDAPAKV